MRNEPTATEKQQPQTQRSEPPVDLQARRTVRLICGGAMAFFGIMALLIYGDTASILSGAAGVFLGIVTVIGKEIGFTLAILYALLSIIGGLAWYSDGTATFAIPVIWALILAGLIYARPSVLYR